MYKHTTILDHEIGLGRLKMINLPVLGSTEPVFWNFVLLRTLVSLLSCSALSRYNCITALTVIERLLRSAGLVFCHGVH